MINQSLERAENLWLDLDRNVKVLCQGYILLPQVHEIVEQIWLSNMLQRERHLANSSAKVTIGGLNTYTLPK